MKLAREIEACIKRLNIKGRKRRLTAILSHKAALESRSARLCSDGKLYFLEMQEVRTRFEQLEFEQAELESSLNALEGLEEKLRFYKSQYPDETWSSKWIATPIAYLLDRRQREEWLGDLREVEQEMLKENQFPLWLINLIIVGRVARLLMSILEVKQVDSRRAIQRKTE